MRSAKTRKMENPKGCIPNVRGMAVIVLFVAMSGSLAEADDLIYCNDFSTRESSNPIPAYGVKHEAQPYALEKTPLCFVPEASTGYSGNDTTAVARMGNPAAYTAKAVSGTDRPNYDGWFTPYFIKASSTQFKIFPTLIKDCGDPAFTWYQPNRTAASAGVTLHPIHNVFTNGLLQMQVDMYTPETWLDKTALYYVRVFPVTEQHMDISAWNGANSTTTIPGRFGLQCAANSGNNYYDDSYFSKVYHSSSVQMGYSGRSNDRRKWVRFLMTYDLDKSTVTGCVYTLAANVGHPTFASVSGNASTFWNGSTECTLLTATSGGVAGIGIDGYGSFHSANTTTNKVLVDNIRLSWKAPGASDFEVFYENDFSNRWYKTICTANHSTLTSGYAPATANVADSSTLTMDSLWTPSRNTFATNNIVPALSALPSAVQPIGFDGWRRLPYMDGNTAYCCNTASTGSQFDSGAGTNYLAFGNAKGWEHGCALLGNLIGETYTSGKVRLSVDARLPAVGSTSYAANVLRASVGLGSTALYSAPRSALAVNLVAGCGYLRKEVNSSIVHVPYVMAASSGPEVSYIEETSYTNPTVSYVYRMEVVADLDARTYAVSVTPLAETGIDSSFVPTDAPIFTKANIAFASSATDIGTFYLRGFGNSDSASVSVSTSTRVTFDNVRIWHQASGTTSEALVYFNDFRTRTRTPSGETLQVARATGYVADQYDLDDGMDHWVRRCFSGDAGYWATATVRDDDGNQFLALGREVEAGQRVQVSHVLGSYLMRPFRFRIDVRPPAAWRVEKGGEAILSLGGSQMEQSTLTDAAFNSQRQVAFGFCDVPGDSYCTWYRTAMQPMAYAKLNGAVSAVPLCDAAAILNDHWYRFCVTVFPSDGTYDIRVYDMGTAHPTEASSAVSLVGAARELAFLNDLAANEGIGAFSIYVNGMGGVLGETGMDSDNVLIDNIRASYISGTVISFR